MTGKKVASYLTTYALVVLLSGAAAFFLTDEMSNAGSLWIGLAVGMGLGLGAEKLAAFVWSIVEEETS